MKTIAFFNTRGGVGSTTLAYHIAWMCSELGQRVLAVDLDPQASLTAMFLDEEHLDDVWGEEGKGQSLLRSISPIIDGTGDIVEPVLHELGEDFYLLPGDPGLVRFEDKLLDSWIRCMDGDQSAFRATSAFYRTMKTGADRISADIVIVDVGPNLGAINRAALLAAGHIIIPLVPGPYSMQGLKILGLSLDTWRESWKQRLRAKPPNLDFSVPAGLMKPAGYVVMQHVERGNRNTEWHDKWVSELPRIYDEYVLHIAPDESRHEENPNRIGYVRNFRSLSSISEEAKKPVFKLTPANGAIGAHAAAVSKCYVDFKDLTEEILRRTSEESIEISA